MRYGGRQLIFKSPEELEARINKYFKACDDDLIIIDSTRGPLTRQKPYTISGLCIHLGISRVTWSEYSSRTEYEEICSMAKLKCEENVVVGGLTGKLHPIMSIFILKNCHGYKDTVDVGLSHTPEPLQVEDIQQLLAQRRLSLVPGRDSEE